MLQTYNKRSLKKIAFIMQDKASKTTQIIEAVTYKVTNKYIEVNNVIYPRTSQYAMYLINEDNMEYVQSQLI